MPPWRDALGPSSADHYLSAGTLPKGSCESQLQSHHPVYCLPFMSTHTCKPFFITTGIKLTSLNRVPRVHLTNSPPPPPHLAPAGHPRREAMAPLQLHTRTGVRQHGETWTAALALLCTMTSSLPSLVSFRSSLTPWANLPNPALPTGQNPDLP